MFSGHIHQESWHQPHFSLPHVWNLFPARPILERQEPPEGMATLLLTRGYHVTSEAAVEATMYSLGTVVYLYTFHL